MRAKGGIKRNVSLDFGAEIEAVFSFPTILFSSRQKDDLPPPSPSDQCVFAAREFAVPMRRTTTLHHHVYSNTVITLHTYTGCVKSLETVE